MNDGHKSLIGVDTSSDPSLNTNKFIAFDAVNRTFRGGVNKTRPPFTEAVIEFDTPECEEVFRNGNITGVFGYKKINNFIQPHLMVAVGDSLLAGRVFATKISFKCIYRGIDPQWQHSFFVQAEDILVWQNGKQDPQVWDGLALTTQSASEAVESVGKSRPMPVGNIMTYAHGRIFVATEDNIVYASDHIYSQGFGKNKTIVNFEESFYPASGDGFGAYSQIGKITGMAVIPRHPEANGHGEVIVFGENGAWAIDPSPIRNQWTELPIQQVVLLGRGCASPTSVIPVNNDIFYRSSDGSISSFKNSITDRREAWSDKSLSREAARYLNFDSIELLQFSSALFVDNRLLMSCGIRGAKSSGYGNHRFGLGLVSLDLDRGSTTSKVDEGFSWDGLWTGPRPAGMASISIDSYPKHYVVSYDSDGQNRIYLLNEGNGGDVSNGVTKKIKSFYSFGDLFDVVSPDRPVAVSTLTGAFIYFSDISTKCYISALHRPDRYQIWTSMMERVSVGCDDPEIHLNGELQGVRRYSGSINTASPARNAFRQASKDSIATGFSHQIQLQIEGVATINRMVASADLMPNDISTNLCRDNDEINCEEVIARDGSLVDEGLYFQYTF